MNKQNIGNYLCAPIKNNIKQIFHETSEQVNLIKYLIIIEIV